MDAKNKYLDDKSVDELVRENETLWELAKLEIRLKKLIKQLDYHRAFTEIEDFRKVMIFQLERKVERIRDSIDSIIEHLDR
ncbi:MAG: hypothetical protein MK226_20445 [Saprospiraceae bacterium]|nr:hypothetical protein [Saprospiraceae bacterium]